MGCSNYIFDDNVSSSKKVYYEQYKHLITDGVRSSVFKYMVRINNTKILPFISNQLINQMV